MTLCKMLGFLMLLIAASKSQIHFNEEKAPCDITYSDLHCIHINKCPEALSGIRRGIFPKPCGFEGKMPLVCCNELTKPGKRSIRQCDHTYEKVKIDGEGTIKYTALVLPKQTLSEQYPHMVSLGSKNSYRKDGRSVSWMCSGSLISEKFVLTTAHCIEDPNEIINVAILGDLDSVGKPNCNSQEYRIIRKVVHPDFRAPYRYNDLAVVELERPVEVTKYVKPACLQTRYDIADAWWETSGYQNQRLYNMRLYESTLFNCDNYFKSKRFSTFLPKGVNYTTQFCAQKSSEETQIQEGTGGPLQTINWHYLDGWTVIGVTVIDAVKGIGLYTRLSHYIPWIESVVWP